MAKINNETEWLGVVKKTVESVRFGTVAITVHNSKVVQVDRTDKIRFESAADRDTALFLNRAE